jgi:hypothetical protein
LFLGILATLPGGTPDTVPDHRFRNDKWQIPGCQYQHGAVTRTVFAIFPDGPDRGLPPCSRHLQTKAHPAPNTTILRKPVLGDIGVKIDASQPWADGFSAGS